MDTENKKISLRQLRILFIIDILGISMIILPKQNAALLGSDGIFLPLGGGVLALISIFLITSLSPYLGKTGFYKGLERLGGKPLARLVSAGLTLKLAFSAALDIRIFSEAARLRLLPQTPLWIICLVAVLPCVYCAVKGYETRARLGEILIFIILIPFLFVFLPHLFDGNFPPLPVNIRDKTSIYIKGSLTDCLTFTGIEFLLLIPNHAAKPEEIKKKLVSALIFAILLIFLVNFVTITELGPALTAKLGFPVSDVMDVSAVSAGKGAVMMSIFYISVVVFVSGAICFGGGLLGDILGSKRLIYVYIIALLSLGLSLIPSSLKELTKTALFFNALFGTAYFFVIPLILNIILRFQKDDVYD